MSLRSRLHEQIKPNLSSQTLTDFRYTDFKFRKIKFVLVAHARLVHVSIKYPLFQQVLVPSYEVNMSGSLFFSFPSLTGSRRLFFTRLPPFPSTSAWDTLDLLSECSEPID